MASRALEDLLPDVARRCQEWLSRLSDDKVAVLVYCTYRSPEEQDALYAKGRTALGPRVTNARGWESWHQMRRAWDCVPLEGGKPVWAYSPYEESWEKMIAAADALGIEWAGRWQSFREYVHFQVVPAGLTLVAARAQVDGVDWRAV